ncbi:hypothetical protein GGI12_005441 [Dipsacomyces acuminosporus]|nr:hypothetical protein GGI12_005441 [Dipsacomyces acuminosporus]
MSEYPSLLGPELASRYQDQVHKVHLGMHATYLPEGYFLPRQLSSLHVDMNSHEKQVLLQISAPSLQSLTILNASPDITWSWFDSGNGNDVWFNKLLSADFRFDQFEPPRSCYHKSNLATRRMPIHKSDYHNAAKRAHFPVLEKLRIKWYPYLDNSFYDLFDVCQLKEIGVRIPLGISHHIPGQLLATVEHMDVSFEYPTLVYQADIDSYKPSASQKLGLQQTITNPVSSPSAVRSVCLSASYFKGVSFPDTFAWRSIQILELELDADVRLIFDVLAKLPKLQKLILYTPRLHVSNGENGDSGIVRHITQHAGTVNKAISHLLFSVEEVGKLAKRDLGYLLTNLLPLVPSLLRLEVTHSLL